MAIELWLKHFEKAYEVTSFKSINGEIKQPKFTENERNFLLQPYSKEKAEEQKTEVLENVEIFTRYFFKKAINGEAFCPPILIEKKFGKTLEQQWGLSHGPFINLARTYWTFRLELDQDQYSKDIKPTPMILPILRTVEINISGVFFPTPGPKTMSVVQRRMRQEQILEQYASEINIKRFISENPILKIEAKRGCLTSVLFIIILLILITSILLLF